jgi:hypothetical protein
LANWLEICASKFGKKNGRNMSCSEN